MTFIVVVLWRKNAHFNVHLNTKDSVVYKYGSQSIN
jgi:hypothetical protein